MIQLNELRIGNWVFDDNKIYSKVIGFKPFDYSVRCDELEGCEILLDLYSNDGSIMDGMMCESSSCEPIPLTPEVLEKCGFVFKPIGDEVYEQIWRIGNFEIWQHDSGFCHDFCSGGDVKYIHQLQNLYFALTGEELEYKP